MRIIDRNRDYYDEYGTDVDNDDNVFGSGEFECSVA